MVELVSSMIVDLKLRVAEFNQKINSTMVEVKRLGENVKNLGTLFTIAGTAGMGLFTALLASSPELAFQLIRLKMLWLDFSRTLGQRLEPFISDVVNDLESAWNWIKTHPFALDFLTTTLELIPFLTVGGVIYKLATLIGLGSLSLPLAFLASLILSFEYVFDKNSMTDMYDLLVKEWGLLGDLVTAIMFQDWETVRITVKEMHELIQDYFDKHPVVAYIVGQNLFGPISALKAGGEKIWDKISGNKEDTMATSYSSDIPYSLRPPKTNVTVYIGDEAINEKFVKWFNSYSGEAGA